MKKVKNENELEKEREFEAALVQFNRRRALAMRRAMR